MCIGQTLANVYKTTLSVGPNTYSKLKGFRCKTESLSKRSYIAIYSNLEKKSIIFDIGRFRNEDGPGIRTIVFFKGCPLRCIWCSNPFGLSAATQMIFNQNKCVGCGVCVKICSAGANRIDGDKAKVEFGRCHACGLCVAPCLSNARSISGKQYTALELFEEVRKDAAFYRRNSGGVTLSGGEVLQQSEVASQLLALCQKNFINTAIETTAYSTWEALVSVARYCSIIFVDLKHINSKKHKEYTGVGNEQILENIERLCEYSKENGTLKVIIRRPIIKDLTDDDETTIRTAQFVNNLPTNPEINLLPYHSLGETKYAMIGQKYSLECNKMLLPSDPLMLNIRDLSSQHAPSCRVSIGGGNIKV